MSDAEPNICIHGLGYIGLPTASVLVNSGYNVAGYDANPTYRDELESGEVDIEESDLARFVGRALNDGLTIVSEPTEADFHVICVPTPYDTAADRIDLSYVEAAGAAISEVLRPDDTVVLSSTVPPGTTASSLRKTLEQSGYTACEDFILGYSPETILPGNTLTELRENDRIVGTVDGQPADRIVALYDSFISGNITTTDATTAEFVKLIQNAYRDTNIAFANEVAKLAHKYGIDSRDAISMANEHPRVDILRPGPGVGGHCIPIDPLFLNHGNDVPILIETVRTVNDAMPDFVLELLSAALGALAGMEVALLGVAYKGGVADTRESPTLTLVDRLEETGVDDIRLSDPYVTDSVRGRDLLSLERSLAGSNAAVIVTDHPEYGALNPQEFAQLMDDHVLIDTRAMLDRDRWESAGFDVYTV
ncbi:nucleotide sugar dehydrogenase [Haloarcula sp. CBA1130]|uniref:nucleotide sugar dehydrogenase n=1 Tax=unclassified Haloarcula TaxID=2624677 RepID=UPI001243B3F0|nr:MULTISPECIES: nucleotide sugar dehydrogenase [unclassified Haloarcula]KAA9398346.1 nucleotide sugar dehydrogenase [Haloarcula sp. CBA1129]KAA9402059.1 nucleotide sugar dehydrogenase [Haloarcula sp. CBA1130]